MMIARERLPWGLATAAAVLIVHCLDARKFCTPGTKHLRTNAK
jgi:hypothetical protein